MHSKSLQNLTDMNKRIINLVGTTAGQLIFALLSGAGYYMVLLRLIVSWSNGSALLAFFFAPVIICGAAIVLIKTMKQARENDNEGLIPRLFWIHTVLFVIGIVFVISMFV